MLQHALQNPANRNERVSSSSKDAHYKKTQEMYAYKNVEKSDRFHTVGRNDSNLSHLGKYNGGSSRIENTLSAIFSPDMYQKEMKLSFKRDICMSVDYSNIHKSQEKETT